MEKIGRKSLSFAGSTLMIGPEFEPSNICYNFPAVPKGTYMTSNCPPNVFFLPHQVFVHVMPLNRHSSHVVEATCCLSLINSIISDFSQTPSEYKATSSSFSCNRSDQ